ncbi:outer membrane transport energization protein TonB [Cellulophaga sp. RHA19]|uniref:M56 family metallopeptidase n=1 Tax=Cellulophaga sp. RHA19 TaxID=1798237 RepID=UPI000C2B740A|nr:M56 family metallopeptidase [Cellulophaga sp. RHA19]PKB43143.1 outer membrane transport energization protein TonB [Cellulophaga sp. RHA19]
MVQYVIESLAFQLVFIIIYDVFLRRETFFQWNRLYLLGTCVLSFLMPLIALDIFKSKVPGAVAVYTPFMFSNYDLDTNAALLNNTNVAQQLTMPWYGIIFSIGVVVALFLFLFKIRQLHKLRKRGEKTVYTDFTEVVLKQSNSAFSFFKTIFLGDKIKTKEYANIIEHELVHIRQKHTVDLLFFEVLRIALWFNPLVYIYQSRISEVHEFIADAKVAKIHRKEQYELLLSQVFQTENISFINHFFSSSLIKKRIKMLQKKQSKKIWASKYLLLLPTIVCILFYTSSKGQEKDTNTESDIQEVKDTPVKQDEMADVPFSVIDEVPVFPGCENATDKRACFNDKINEHIRKHFSYPESAQKEGVQGRVSVRFVMMEDGSIGKIQMRGPDVRLEEVALNIIKKIPNVTPGKQRGKAVKVPFSLPITFKLTPESDKEKLTKDVKAALLRKEQEEKDRLYKDAKEVPFSVIDEVPVFPGCENATDKKACFNDKINEHIRKHFSYPESAQKEGVQGRVSVRFVMMEDGSIGKIQMRGPDVRLEEVALNIIKKLPNVTPGKQRGKAVKVPFSLPITFKLQKKND